MSSPKSVLSTNRDEGSKLIYLSSGAMIMSFTFFLGKELRLNDDRRASLTPNEEFQQVIDDLMGVTETPSKYRNHKTMSINIVYTFILY